MSEDAGAHTTSSHTPVHHVFVDVENMKKIDPAVARIRNLALHLFMGPDNKKLDLGSGGFVLEHSQISTLIRTPRSGKNALDFVLAYHLGQVALAEPKSHFHIVSKDAGFDVLIEHLNARNIKAMRHADWANLLALSAPKSKPTTLASTSTKSSKPTARSSATAKPTPAELSQEAQKLWNLLLKNPRNRPKKLKTLQTKALDFAGKEKNQTKANSFVDELCKAGHIAIDDKDAVKY